MEREILAPAGNEEAALASLYAGADAIYLGLGQFSARSGAGIGQDALSRIVCTAHLLGARVHVALNTLVKDSETDDFFALAVAAWNAGADALLIQDIFLGRELKRAYPSMVLHLSTQAGCCNAYGAEAAREFGFSRVVLARETPLSEIRKISSVIETEAFVQGALCTAFSGQCYFSSFAGNNSGNRGRCKQPCRKRYRIDRKGYEEEAYALSLSDLSVRERIFDLADAGVTSFKIEGRLRRPAYCAFAVSYYRALLAGEDGKAAFRALKRAYNRGDYTYGLAFGQKDLLSRDVQGHIGERVGFVSGKNFVKSDVPMQKGDAFKILRGGKEVGGAAFSAPAQGGFWISSAQTLCAGDEVRLTTREEPLPVRLRPVDVEVCICAGEEMRVRCGDVCLTGGRASAAKNAPLTQDKIRACFGRVDGLPLAPRITVQTDGAFVPVSELNAFRREFYAALSRALAPARPPLALRPHAVSCTPVRGEERAAIGIKAGDEILIYAPRDLRAPVPPAHGGKVYLYLPPFLTSEEAERLMQAPFDGIYCEGYYGIKLAQRYQKELFAGVGFNLTNAYAVAGVREFAPRFVLSKEISLREQDALSAAGAFALRAGAIKLMDLIYCPFERTCGDCDRREIYRMTDEDGREFPLRRYVAPNGDCRFEVYNCADLAPQTGLASPLSDGRAESGAQTRGHSERSMQ